MREIRWKRRIVSAGLLLLSCLLPPPIRSAATEHKSPEQWLASLRSKDEKIRLLNAYNIESMIPFSRRTVSLLIKALNDKDPYVRRYSASALGEATESFDQIVPALIPKLSDQDFHVREHATLALAKIGLAAVPALVGALKKTTPLKGSSSELSKLSAKDLQVFQDQELGSFFRRVTVSDYAAVALLEIGEPAVDELAKAFSSKSTHVQRYAGQILQRIGEPAFSVFLNHLRDLNVRIRIAARLGLEKIPVTSTESLPVLRELGRSREVELRVLGIDKMAEYGSLAWPDLQNALRDTDKNVRMAAINAWSRLDTETKLSSWSTLLPLALDDKNPQVRASALAAVVDSKISVQVATPFISLLKDSEASVRRLAAKALGQIGQEDTTVTPVLFAALQDPDPYTRAYAASSLAMRGCSPELAVPKLLSAFKTFPPAEDEAAVMILQALMKVGGDRQEVIAILAESLKKKSRIRTIAAKALKDLGDKAAPAIPIVVNAIETMLAQSDRNPYSVLRVTAFDVEPLMDALASMGPRGFSNFLGLMQRIKDPNVLGEGARILGRINGEDQRVVDALALLLGNSDPRIRRSALEGLSTMTARRSQTVSIILEALKDTDKNVRKTALSSVQQIGPEAADAIPTIVAELRDEEPTIRMAAALALSAVDPHNEAGVLMLVEQLNQRETGYISELAASTLIKIGKRAVPAVVKVIKHQNPVVRRHALSILKELGAESLPYFMEAVGDSDVEVRLYAAKEISRINDEPNRERVGERLCDLLGDSNHQVRLAAAYGLLDIGFDIKKVLPQVSTIVNDDLTSSILSRDIDDLFPQELVAFGSVLPKFEWYSSEIRLVSAIVGNNILSSINAARFRLPGFFWPVPRFSDWRVIPSKMLGSDNDSLDTIHAKLSGTLSSLGYGTQGLFEMPEGFALVTRVERYNEDGTSCPEPIRWTSNRVPPSSWRDYLSILLRERPGQFRLFVFIITKYQNLDRANWSLSEETAWNLAYSGGKVLSDDIKRTLFKDHFCHALIYVFRKKAGLMAAPEYQDPLGLDKHLTNSGILSRL